MNHRDPTRRFLGLDPSADPIEVLGLDPARLDTTSILRAREARGREIDDHPDGQSEDANQVRAHVHDAAEVLLDPKARLPVLARHVPADLRNRQRAGVADVTTITSFDREVLGVLMACGGWNSRSRARLMVIASQHGVSPIQLMDVLMGMTRWLRSGGSTPLMPGVGVAMPGSTIQTALASTMTRPTTEAFDRFVERWTPDIRASDSASVTRLSVLFGCTAILLLVLIVGFLLSTPEGRRDDSTWPSSSDMQAPSSSTNSASATDPTGGLETEEVGGGEEALLTKLDLPRSLHDSADALVGTTVGFDLLADGIARGEDASVTEARFSELMDVAARGWFLTGEAQRTELMNAVKRLFVMLGDDSQLARSLVARLAPSTPARIDIEQIPMEAFRAGVLAALADDRQISPSIREEARSQLVTNGLTGLDGPGFGPAALAWLKIRQSRLVDDSETSPDAETAWLAWIRAVKAIDDKARSQEAMVAAVDALLNRGLWIGRPGPTRRTLVRLLSELDYTDSELVRETVLGFYENPTIPSRRLWVLSSLLARMARTPWFDASMVVDPSADETLRRDLRDQLASRWPVPPSVTFERISPVPAGFNAGIASLWLDQWDVLQESNPGRTDDDLLLHLLRMRLLNQSAAALADGDVAATIRVLRMLETDELVSDDLAPAGQPTSMNGWRHRMSKAKTREDKIRTLDELSGHKSGDLKTADAIELAHVALMEAVRIREHAQEIIKRRFRDDPELVLALLDQLPRRPAKSVSEFLEVVIDRDLPDLHSSRWAWETRRALSERAMALRPVDAETIDELTSLFVTSFLEEVRRLTDQDLADDMLPVEAIGALASARADRVRAEMAASDMSILADARQRHESRLRLAEDSLQQALVQSLAVLDLLSLEWSIKLPSRAASIEMIGEDTLLQLPVSSHVLDQLLIVEQAIGETWRLVLLTYRQRAREGQEEAG